MWDGIATNTLLADTARALGITPIPEAVLTAHKLAEVKKHPASWWYHHQIVPFFMFVGFLAATAVITDPVGSAITGVISSFLGLGALLIVTGNVTIRGPAMWEETWYGGMPSKKQVPHDVAEMAKRIVALVPGTVVVIGELHQSKIMLDPYLVIRHGTEKLVLGIWDDSGIIHQATYE